MDKNCNELLENIHRTLHKCRDNKRFIEISGELDIRKCQNITNWARNIKDCIPLNIEIKNPLLKNKYSIEYKVTARSLIIE